MQILISQINNRKIAFYIKDVERVLHSVKIEPLHETPENIMGIINYHGEIIPVIKIRQKLSMPEKRISLSDKFIILKGEKRNFGIVADEVFSVQEIDENEISDINSVYPELTISSKVLKIKGETVIIANIENFLLSEEIFALDEILNKLEKNS